MEAPEAREEMEERPEAEARAPTAMAEPVAPEEPEETPMWAELWEDKTHQRLLIFIQPECRQAPRRMEDQVELEARREQAAQAEAPEQPEHRERQPSSMSEDLQATLWAAPTHPPTGTPQPPENPTVSATAQTPRA